MKFPASFNIIQMELFTMSESKEPRSSGSNLDLCKVCVILLLGLEATTASGIF